MALFFKRRNPNDPPWSLNSMQNPSSVQSTVVPTQKVVTQEEIERNRRELEKRRLIETASQNNSQIGASVPKTQYERKRNDAFIEAQSDETNPQNVNYQGAYNARFAINPYATGSTAALQEDNLNESARGALMGAGAIGLGGKILGAVKQVAPIVSQGLNTSIAGIQGATPMNLINAGFAAEGLYNLPGSVKRMVDNPSAEGALDIGLNTLYAAPIIPGIKKLASPASSLLTRPGKSWTEIVQNITNNNIGSPTTDINELRRIYQNSERILSLAESAKLSKYGLTGTSTSVIPKSERLRTNHAAMQQLISRYTDYQRLIKTSNPERAEQLRQNAALAEDKMSWAGRAEIRRILSRRYDDHSPELLERAHRYLDNVAQRNMSRDLFRLPSSILMKPSKPIRAIDDVKTFERFALNDKEKDAVKLLDEKNKWGTGVLSYNSELDQAFKLESNGAIPKTEQIDDLITQFKSVKEKVGGHPIARKIDTQLEDLYSTKFLRTSFKDELIKQGKTPSLDLSIVTSPHKTKYLVDGQGNIIGNLSQSDSRVGTAAVMRNYHGDTDLGRQEKAAQALYRGVHHGLVGVGRDPLMSTGNFAATTFTTPAGTTETLYRAERFWEGLVRKGIAEKSGGVYKILKTIPPALVTGVGLGTLYNSK